MSQTRYRFAEFTVSPAERLLRRSGEEVPLIPRYFELLILLLARRHEAVHRREIFDTVWSDVVVSDGALSQAIRTLRRALADDSRNPVFIRTVSRHGYRFVYPDVREEPDTGALPPPAATLPASRDSEQRGASAATVEVESRDAAFDRALEQLLAPGALPPGDDDERREAAESLHALGTAEALRRLDRREGHEVARALLRDTRWDVAGSGAVPLLGSPGGAGALRVLIALRLRRAARLAGRRWASASAGGAVAGAVAGLAGGLLLHFSPGSASPASIPVALALIAACIGGLGAAGVGAGLAAAEALARSLRGAALVILGGLGGGTIGAMAHLLGRWTLEGLFGHDLSPVGGGFEGLVVGAAAGAGYALSTPRPGGGGMATPRGGARLTTACVTGLFCAAGCVGLTWAGGNLGGVSLDFMARTFQGSQVGLSPIARLFGEEGLGPVTRTVLGAYEGMLFGFGLALGLTRRPR